MKCQRGFESQSRGKADSKELLNGQEVSLKETANNDILSKIFLYVRLWVKIRC